MSKYWKQNSLLFWSTEGQSTVATTYFESFKLLNFVQYNTTLWHNVQGRCDWSSLGFQLTLPKKSSGILDGWILSSDNQMTNDELNNNKQKCTSMF